MRTLDELRELLAKGQYELTRHALQRIVERNISKSEIQSAAGNLEIVEEYRTDKYGPSCLLLGWTTEKRPLHIQATLEKETAFRIITIYEPDPKEWENFRVRRETS